MASLDDIEPAFSEPNPGEVTYDNAGPTKLEGYGKPKPPRKNTPSKADGNRSNSAAATAGGSSALSKQISVKDYKASLLIWVSVGLLLFTFIVHLIVFSCPGWVWVTKGDVTAKIGLWQECRTDDGCRYYGVSELSDAHRASQAFATITFLSLFAALLLSFVNTLNLHTKAGSGVGLLVCHGSAALFLLLTVSIFGDLWADKKYDYVSSNGILHWAYGLEVVCLFFELAATACLVLEVFIIPPNDTDDTFSP